jgi:uncharacterized sulfatase
MPDTTPTSFARHPPRQPSTHTAHPPDAAPATHRSPSPHQPQIKASPTPFVALRLNFIVIAIIFTGMLGGTVRLRAATESTRLGGVPERPNILWLTAEDLSPHLGCYGDAYATTPHLDQLAARGVRYRQAWSGAPVCAPARTTLILGLHATSAGAHHMRSAVAIPSALRLYPQLLRAAGYYCVNNAKEDYNVIPHGRVWDESSKQAHWRKRASGQPFFAVFNFEITHESKLRSRPHTPVHGPARVPLPPYHPDTPEVRRDWAQSYDNITTMDSQVAERLRELEQAGLAENTIVFFYGDHGSGMPRSKRWPYNSGLRVPLIVRIPDRWRHLAPADYVPGGTSDRLVDFSDLGPTACSLAGVRPPASMHGSPFLGRFTAPARRYNAGYRGRMDERTDLVRSITDGRYVYIRNFLPHLIYGQHLAYMFETPTTRVWQRLYAEGRLVPPQTYFWEPKPSEELYDLQADPHEVHNLAGSPGHTRTRERLGAALRTHLLETRDVGFLPEAEMHRLSQAEGLTPYELGQSDRRYPLARLLEIAALASSAGGQPGPVDPHPARTLTTLREALSDPHSGVRWWGAKGLRLRGGAAVGAALPELRRALDDASPSVRIAAAEALGRHGPDPDAERATRLLVSLAQGSSAPESSGPDGRRRLPDQQAYWTALEALQAIEDISPRARAWLPSTAFSTLTVAAPVEKKLQEYAPRLLEWLRR